MACTWVVTYDAAVFVSLNVGGKKQGDGCGQNTRRHVHIAVGRNRAACVWVAYNAAGFVSLWERRREETGRWVWSEYPPPSSYRRRKEQGGVCVGSIQRHRVCVIAGT